MDSKKIAKIRLLVERDKNLAPHARYSPFVRSVATELLRKGVSPTKISNSTGIGRPTLYQWRGAIRKKRFRKIKVSNVKPEIKTDLKITLPSGVSIECSSTEILKSILELYP